MYFKGALSGLRQFLTTDSPLKMTKNAFYFTSKALFVLKIFKFLSWLKETIAIHVLPNKLRNKDNQATKFGQLREYSMKNIFHEKPYTKYGGETRPGPFSEKLKLSISLDQQSEFLFNSFYCIFK